MKATNRIYKSRPVQVTLLTIFLLFSTAVYSQPYIQPSWRFTTNPQKLADRITIGLGSDSAKVLAIHDWLCWNIRYDVKKVNRYDLKQVKVKKILRTRKAICTGYSDLFDTLCKHAGLKSVSIPGYTKNMEVDIQDTFYMADHSWNAAFINDKWYLFDACWDAGYIQFKRPLLAQILNTLTFNSARNYKTKESFKREPSSKYRMKTGDAFITDHLAIVPLWQLIQNPLTIEEFSHDSTFYYNRTPKLARYPLNDGLQTERLAYYELPEAGKYIYLGENSLAFNPLSHYYYANSQVLKAVNLASSVNTSGTNMLQLPGIYDSVMLMLENAVTHFDSNAICLGRQKESLLRNNKSKNELFKSKNSTLINSSKNVIRQAKKGKGVCIKISERLEKMGKSNEEFADRFSKNQTYNNAKSPGKTNQEDSAKYWKELSANSDSIQLRVDNLKSLFFQADSQGLALVKNNSGFQNMSPYCTKIGTVLYNVRQGRFDDFDYEIKYISDTLMLLKLANDSLLFNAEGTFLPQILSSNIQNQNNELVKYRKLITERQQILQKLKRACHYVDTLNEIYISTYQDMVSELTDFANQQSILQGRLKKAASGYRSILNDAGRELKVYNVDKEIAKDNFKTNNKSIISKSAALTKANTKQKNNTQKIKGDIQKHK